MFYSLKETRIRELLPSKDKIFDLMSKDWTNSSIANYMGSDDMTLKRFRVAYKKHGKTASDNDILATMEVV